MELIILIILFLIGVIVIDFIFYSLSPECEKCGKKLKTSYKFHGYDSFGGHYEAIGNYCPRCTRKIK